MKTGVSVEWHLKTGVSVHFLANAFPFGSNVEAAPCFSDPCS
jgi:hypothetical protein